LHSCRLLSKQPHVCSSSRTDPRTPEAGGCGWLESLNCQTGCCDDAGASPMLVIVHRGAREDRGARKHPSAFSSRPLEGKTRTSPHTSPHRAHHHRRQSEVHHASSDDREGHARHNTWHERRKASPHERHHSQNHHSHPQHSVHTHSGSPHANHKPQGERHYHGHHHGHLCDMTSVQQLEAMRHKIKKIQATLSL
jgi:hypothetical protein